MSAAPWKTSALCLRSGSSRMPASSASSGALVQRMGTGAATVLAATLSLSGLATYAVSATWPWVLAAAVLLGLGGGLLDSTLNANAAHHFSAGAMNLMHAGFGIGATLGPVVMAVAVSRGTGWQAGYVVYVIAQSAMLVVLFVSRRRWPGASEDIGRPPTVTRTFDAVIVGSLAMFFLYTGIEVAAGQWSFSVLTEGRGLSTVAGGAWVAAYWGGLTVGRLALSAVAGRLGTARVLSISMVGSIAATSWFWWNPSGLGVLGLPALGLSLAGVFPTLVTLTPVRLGPDRTTVMVGYQLAAASLGAAAVPWIGGRIIAATSLAAIAPFLVSAAATMALLNGLLNRRASLAAGRSDAAP